MSSMRPVPAAVVAAALLLAALAAAGRRPGAVGAPDPDDRPGPSTPGFVGHAATPRPLAGVRPAWTNPFMARNPVNSVHNDPWQSDAYTQYGGPLGRRRGRSRPSSAAPASP